MRFVLVDGRKVRADFVRAEAVPGWTVAVFFDGPDSPPRQFEIFDDGSFVDPSRGTDPMMMGLARRLRDELLAERCPPVR